ncbi:uncharacterized protein LOC130813674 [Amaranthus tricolor]|uniref:uncharacterized protein LOC130813674 n=1 Tax=Amaranthus tricolor TaxID=29722 RepID=UPI002588F213|nr:uncharacterized protein LOC130813674 [Amaranthus tricolor]XP_057535506.1 uncharacterized protein LOC130813674 [Amaranthus tricolor]
MGSLATHFSTFLFLFPIGSRRLYSSCTLFLKNPSHYQSKPWFFIDPQLKNFDLYSLLIALPVAGLSDLFLFLSFSGNPSYRFSFFQYGTVIFIFWALLLLIILRESYDLFVINESFLFAFGGVCFLVEYFITGNGFNGVSNNVYNLGGYLTLLCAFSCLYLSFKPTTFLADFFLSSGMIFKGTWVLQVGLNLYTSTFGLKGCQQVKLLPNQSNVDVKCDLDEDSMRGIALMKLLFVWHAIVVIIACFGLFGLLSCREKLRCGEGSGPLLAKIDSHSVLMQQLPEFELE